jgi:transposase
VPISGDKFSRQYSVVAEMRRRWSDGEKEAVIAEAAKPGANISAVARRHGIKPSLLFRWRRLAREDQGCANGPAFVPVTLALPPPGAETPAPETAPPASAAAPRQPHLPDEAQGCSSGNRVEIELGNGRLVRVYAGVDTDGLKRILDLLERPGSKDAAPGRGQRA